MNRNLRLALAAIALAVVSACGSSSNPQTEVQFVYTSDPHYGITRSFRGATGVSAQAVNQALVGQLNAISTSSLPATDGARPGQTVGAIDFAVQTGDIANRSQLVSGTTYYQSAATSWGQFKADYIDGTTLRDHDGLATQWFLVPGNHDVSNAIGYTKALTPATDATVLVEMYNRMVKPATVRTTATYDYKTDKVFYSRDVRGVHFVFVNMWPDAAARTWLATDLASVSATTPVVLFTHDEPPSESKHFTSPSTTSTVYDWSLKFENLLTDVFADSPATTATANLVEQRSLVAFLKAHRNVVAYFHGNSNSSEFYDFTGPDADITLHTFRVDSPMKGTISGIDAANGIGDESKLSYMLVTIDTVARTLTAREVLWNGTMAAGAPLAFGAQRTVSIAPPP
ncbi:MAG: metallophosphoesterase [Deltaproteobacteria bacterium]